MNTLEVVGLMLSLSAVLASGAAGMFTWYTSRNSAAASVTASFIDSIEKMTSVLEKKEMRLDRAEEAERQLRGVYDDLKRDMQDMKEENEAKGARISALEAQLGKVQALVQEKDREIHNLKVQIEKLEEQSRGKEQTIRRMQSRIEALEGERNELREERERLLRQVDSLTRELARLNGEERETKPLNPGVVLAIEEMKRKEKAALMVVPGEVYEEWKD
jgi:chromosome segregation ATPase